MSIAIPSTAYARAPVSHWRHTTWSAREGAPGSVQAIAQTADGYLWVGAATGLYRFDGISFERFSRSIGKRPQSEAVDTLMAMPSGALLVGHDWGGVSVIRRGQHVAVENGAPGSTMRRILLGPDGAIWTIAEGPNAPIIARFTAGKWRVFAASQHVSAERFGSAAVARDGTLWITVGRRLFYLDQSANHLQIVGDPFPANSRIVQDRAGDAWVFTDTGMRRLLPAKNGRVATVGPVAIETPATPGEHQIAYAGDGHLWSISRARGVERYTIPMAVRGRPSAAQLLDQFLAERSALLVPATTLFDREGNLWVGSETGLEQFTPASFGPLRTDGTAVATTRWAGTMVLQDGARDVYLRQGESLFKVAPGRTMHRLPYRVLATDVPCPGRNAGVWIRDARGFVRIGSATTRHIPLDAKTRADLAGGCAEDGLGRLWVLQAGRDAFGYVMEHGRGGVLLSGETGKIPNEAIADTSGQILAYIGRGTLWRTDGQRVEALWRNRDVGIEFIEFLYQGPRFLLMGGPAGLARYDGHRIQVLTSSRFPFLAHLSGAVQTRSGQTWLQNAKGVVRLSTADLDRAFVDPRFDLTGRTFDADDGLPGIGPYFSLSSLTEDKGGRIWVATTNGIAWADPASLPRNPRPPPVTITGLRAGDTHYGATESLVLAKGISRIEIDYAGLSLTNPKRVRFRYRVYGVDADWIDAGTQRQAAYTNLAPGTYRFQVLAANDDGVWNRVGATLHFEIPPTFVQSRWFLALCLMGVGALLWLLYSLRMRQVTSRVRARSETRLAERERIARDLHDTLLQGFQSLILRFQSVANAIPGDQRARAMIEDALDSADAVLEEGRDSVHRLRTARAQNLPETLAETAARMREDYPMVFTMIVEGTPRASPPAIQEELVRIGNEAIINAFQHSRAQMIELVISYHRTALLLGVRDDGVGIAADIVAGGGREGHFGLIGMRERAHQIGAEIKIASRRDSGTEILVRVPARFGYEPHRGSWTRETYARRRFQTNADDVSAI